MSKDELLKEQLKKMLLKARRSIASAERQIKESDYDFASSRTYYAVFYAMEAILLSKNLVLSKHSGVIGAFNQHFIKTAIFPKEFSKQITRLFRDRQIGDYEFELNIEKDEAEEDSQIAKEIVEAIAKYLSKGGYISNGIDFIS